MFKTIEKNAEAVIIEKKSKFIANIFYVESEEEAEEKITMIRKQYHDSRHNCYAYRVNKDDSILQKQSDDGEPSGTAGAPMLSILEKRELVNVLVVVTRYFGGILLGTGGLVKAYSEATQKAIQNANQVEKESGYIAEVIIGYDEIEKFEYLCRQDNIKIVQKDYTEKIKMLIEISKLKYDKIQQKNTKNNFQKMSIKIKEEKFINKI